MISCLDQPVKIVFSENALALAAAGHLPKKSQMMASGGDIELTKVEAGHPVSEDDVEDTNLRLVADAPELSSFGRSLMNTWLSFVSCDSAIAPTVCHGRSVKSVRSLATHPHFAWCMRLLHRTNRIVR